MITEKPVKKLTALFYVLMVFAAIYLFPGGSKRTLQEDAVGTSLVSAEEKKQALKVAAQGDPEDIESFLKWATDLGSENKEVLLAYASEDYKVLAYNCLLSLKKVGVFNAGILTLDDETVEFFIARDIPAYNVLKITKGIPEDVKLGNDIVPDDLDLSRLTNPKGWSSRWNDKTSKRWKHWMLRHYLALRVLKEGYGVYQTDVDMVFINNPYDWLDTKADLEGQSQNWPNENSLNLGIGHVAPSLGGLLHWETNNNLMRYTGDDPQSMENIHLMDPLVAQVGTISVEPCRAEYPELSCTWKKTPMINFRIWSANILPMGYDTSFIYPEDGAVTTIPLLGIHVHVTYRDYQTGKTALYMQYCKERGIWFISKEDEAILFSATSRKYI